MARSNQFLQSNLQGGCDPKGVTTMLKWAQRQGLYLQFLSEAELAVVKQTWDACGKLVGGAEGSDGAGAAILLGALNDTVDYILGVKYPHLPAVKA